MNQIQSLYEKVRAEFPSAKVSLNEPAKPNGGYMLDIILDGKIIVITWMQYWGNSFGLTKDPSPDFITHQSDEEITGVEGVMNRLKEIL